MAVGPQNSSVNDEEPKGTLYARFCQLSRKAAVGIVMLLAGLVYAGWLAPYHRDEFVIVQGGELALIALVRLLINGHTLWFFRGLVILGIGIPFVCALTSPIYWSGGLTFTTFAETFAIGLIPGLIIAFLGYRGLSLVNEAEGRLARSKSAYWYRAMKVLCDVALWCLVGALMTGVWSDVTVGAVILSTFVLLGTVFALLHATLRKATLGKALLLMALGCVIAAFVIVSTQGPRCQEAMLGVPIGMVLGLAGAVVWKLDEE